MQIKSKEQKQKQTKPKKQNKTNKTKQYKQTKTKKTLCTFPNSAKTGFDCLELILNSIKTIKG